jgi:hypothetical protein
MVVACELGVHFPTAVYADGMVFFRPKSFVARYIEAVQATNVLAHRYIPDVDDMTLLAQIIQEIKSEGEWRRVERIR